MAATDEGDLLIVRRDLALNALRHFGDIPRMFQQAPQQSLLPVVFLGAALPVPNIRDEDAPALGNPQLALRSIAQSNHPL